MMRNSSGILDMPLIKGLLYGSTYTNRRVLVYIPKLFES